MAISFKLLIFVFFLSDYCFANAFNGLPTNFSNRSLDRILHDKVTRLKRYDKITASNIISAYKMVKKGYSHKKVFRNCRKSVYQNHNFTVFKDWIDEVYYISNEKDHRKLRAYCSQVSNKNELLPLKKSLRHQSKLFCVRKYMDNLTTNFRKTKKISSRDLKSIKNNIPSLVHSYNEDNLYGLLDYMANSRSDIHKIVSQYISDYYVSHRKTPKIELLKHIKITAELTRLIQLKGIERDSVYNVFAGQLRSLIDDAFDAADNNRPHAEIISKTNHIVNFYTLNQDHLPIKYSLKKLFSLGKSLSRRERFDAANKIFHLMAKYPSSYLENAYFEILWTNITTKNYKAAYRVVKKLNLVAKINNFSSSKLKYWIAFTLMQNDNNKYLSIMRSIVDTDPLDFYAVMSAKNLTETLNISTDQVYKNLLIENKVPVNVTTKTFTPEIYKSLIRLKAWGELDVQDLVKIENESLTDYYSQKVSIRDENKKNQSRSILTYLSAKALYETENYLESFKVIYKGLSNNTLELNANILSTLFPRPYWNKIKSHSRNFDPTIALSLIRQESGFNKRARSMAGARGLMQIMPATGRMYRKRLRAKQLERPNLNIWIGTKYFQNLLSRYDHNLVYALAAYNAGEGRVDRWQKDYLTSSSILHNIESIPFKETRKYVKLIFRNIFFYKLLESRQKLQDSEHPNKLFNIALGFKQ